MRFAWPCFFLFFFRSLPRSLALRFSRDRACKRCVFGFYRSDGREEYRVQKSETNCGCDCACCCFWCIPCHELEHFTYSDPAVIKALTPFTRLKVDATNPDTDEALEPLERFDIA